MLAKRIESGMRTFLITAAIVGAIWLAPGAAAAQAIHACVHNKTGALRIASTCKKDESTLSWNQTGPAGPAGPPGQLAAVANVQQLNIVNSSKKVLASLGTTSDGNVMTFFDSSGNKTLTVGNDAKEDAATLKTWDGNNIIAGTGIYRTAFGEGNSSNVSGGGFGFNVADSTGKLRAAAGTTPDLSEGYFETIDPNGSSTGIVDDDRAQFVNQGFFANDSNGKTRSFVGNSLDGTTFNEFILFDSSGNFAASLFQGPQSGTPTNENGTGLEMVEPGGSFRAGVSLPDGTGVAWALFDTNNNPRVAGGFFGSTEAIDEYSSTGVVVGHLP